MSKTEKRTRAPRIPKAIKAVVQAAEDKKANYLTVLDLRKAQGFTDYFVICSGTNSRQIRAIADGIEEALAAHPRWDHRHTLQHCQMADEAQFRRMARLGVCANLFANQSGKIRSNVVHFRLQVFLQFFTVF